jgi:hypothetical protein
MVRLDLTDSYSERIELLVVGTNRDHHCNYHTPNPSWHWHIMTFLGKLIDFMLCTFSCLFYPSAFVFAITHLSPPLAK